jgi:hypothetical protein
MEVDNFLGKQIQLFVLPNNQLLDDPDLLCNLVGIIALNSATEERQHLMELIEVN